MSGGGKEGIRTATPPPPGSPDRIGERCTLKVHLPDGRFNVVRHDDASDMKVCIFQPYKKKSKELEKMFCRFRAS